MLGNGDAFPDTAAPGPSNICLCCCFCISSIPIRSVSIIISMKRIADELKMIHEKLLDMEYYSHLAPPTLPVAKVQAPTRTDSGNISVSPKILSTIVSSS